MEKTTFHLNTLSKLLAVENISVMKTNDRTASFDIVNRVLRMPTFKETNYVLETMLTFHEIGHALYTPMEYVEIIKKEEKKKNFHYYLNVVEDVRIEKLIKVKYPGTVKDFLFGYQEVIKTDLLGIKKCSLKELNAMSLIDRLNIRFKVGIFCGVKFSSEEEQFINKIEQCVSITDVYKVCLELYNFVEEKKKEEQEQKKQQSKKSNSNESGDNEEQTNQSSDNGDDIESGDNQSNSNESGDNEEQTNQSSDNGDDIESGDNQSNSNESGDNDKDDNKNNSSKQDVSNQPGEATPFNTIHKSETVDSFNNALRSGIDYNISNYVDLEVSGEYIETTPEDTLKFFNSLGEIKLNGAYKKFKLDNSRVVNHMVQLFESKKAAEEYKKNQTNKSGQLSSSKLVNYLVSENIFKTYNVVHDEKNHGIIIFLDWSASIGSMFSSYMEQLSTLITFCRKVGIKYKVITFTASDIYSSTLIKAQRAKSVKQRKEFKNVFASNNSIAMNEITNSEVSVKNEDFIMSCFYESRNSWNRSETYKMSNTPLLATFIYANNMINEYKARRNLNKMAVVFITDGMDNEYGKGYMINGSHSYYGKNIKLINRRTGKDVKLNKPDSIERVITAQIMMKEEHPDVKFVCFHIGLRTLKHINPYQYVPNQGRRECVVANNAIIDEERKIGYKELKSQMFDKLFIIDKVDLIDSKWTIERSDSKRNILNKFIEQQTSTVNSRIIAQKFIECIA